MIIIIIMNLLQEMTIFGGCQKLTSALEDFSTSADICMAHNNQAKKSNVNIQILYAISIIAEPTT